MKNGQATSRRWIQPFELEKWFFREEHFRPQNTGHVFFVHTKFLLVDPLPADPLVCSGSANFSNGSLLENDENMLLVRGNTRVADIYLTEFDRIFRHFFFRDVANELHTKGNSAESIFLDEKDAWTASYFIDGHTKNSRRLMFFATPARTWIQNATDDQKRLGKSPKVRSTTRLNKGAKRAAKKTKGKAATSGKIAGSGRKRPRVGGSASKTKK